MTDSRHRLGSSGGSVSRMSQLQSRFTGGRSGQQQQPETYIVSPYQNQLSSLVASAADTPNPPSYAAVRPTTVLAAPSRPVEPTHFHWNTSSRRRRQANQQPSDGTTSDYKARLNCTVSHFVRARRLLFERVTRGFVTIVDTVLGRA